MYVWCYDFNLISPQTEQFSDSIIEYNWRNVEMMIRFPIDATTRHMPFSQISECSSSHSVCSDLELIMKFWLNSYFYFTMMSLQFHQTILAFSSSFPIFPRFFFLFALFSFHFILRSLGERSEERRNFYFMSFVAKKEKKKLNSGFVWSGSMVCFVGISVIF